MLDYEAEEAAILNATGAGGGQPAVDLIVEKSGTLALLGECVAREAPDVLHLSCHGQSEPEPLLMLESDEGAVCPMSAEQLSLELLGPRPKLLFLSACHSAQGSAVVDSPATLTWVHLPPVDATEGRKQAYQKRLPSGVSPPDADRVAHCIAAARGNPGLQNWLFQQAATVPERCNAALLSLARYLTDGVTPEQADV